MPYSDPEKQKEANKRKQKAYRLRKKGVTLGVTESPEKHKNGVTGVTQGVTQNVTPEFMQGMLNWASLRGNAMGKTASVKTPEVKLMKAVSKITSPKAPWEEQKHSQIERFLKGKEK